MHDKMPDRMNRYIVHGDIACMEGRKALKAIKNGYITVSDGKIESVSDTLPSKDVPLYDYSGHLVIPGLVDLHTHASQYAFRGMHMDKELLPWLNEHTFPEEAKFKDTGYAKEAYGIFADDLLHSATTSAVIFSTIHREAALILMKLLEDRGLSAYVGKVNMDRNSPEFYVEGTDESLLETERFIDDSESFSLVKPIITPRFFPAVSPKLLEGLSKIAIDGNIPMQSHLSENLSEIGWVHSLEPRSESYAHAYAMHGAWGAVKTVMAHAVWSKGREDELLKNGNIFIAHCPDSNMNLSSGIAPVSYYLDLGVNVGLGTDIAAGESLSIMNAMKNAVKASKMLRALGGGEKPLDFLDAFYLATLAGGKFFGKTGSFIPGYDADIVVIGNEAKCAGFSSLSIKDRLERHVYISPEEGVSHKIVKGRILF